jgi:hypothetical protein
MVYIEPIVTLSNGRQGISLLDVGDGSCTNKEAEGVVVHCRSNNILSGKSMQLAMWGSAD